MSPAPEIFKGDKMSALSLRIPNSIHKYIKEIAQKEGVSINQFISSAVTRLRIFNKHFSIKRKSETSGAGDMTKHQK